MSKETGGPAFPSIVYDNDYEVYFTEGGMILRDYFAAKAMQGFCAGGCTNTQDIAKAAYIVADAMLKAREQ